MLKTPFIENGEQIYLDYHSTTPVDPRVLEAILPYFSHQFGNPASETHSWGWAAQGAVEAGRKQVADFLGARPQEILFTSGATESNNHAIYGVMQGDGTSTSKGHLITVATEHKSVLDPTTHLRTLGYNVTVLPVERGSGKIHPQQVFEALKPETKLVSVMLANNEIGTIQPLAEISKLTKAHGALLHCDAVQGTAYLDCNVQKLGVDLLSLSAHKLYGPKGVGALYIRNADPRVSLPAFIRGGGQEKGMRAGTLNVPGIVGLAKACALALESRAEESSRILALRNALLEKITAQIPGIRINGTMEKDQRLPQNLNFTVPGVMPDALLTDLRHLALSTGSACLGDGSSHVMKALYGNEESGMNPSNSLTLRVGLGRFTTADQIEKAANILAAQSLKAQEKFKKTHSQRNT